MNIPYTRHDILSEDITAVTNALESGILSGGEEVVGLETEFSSAVEAPYAVAASSGTAALHMAVHSLGVNPEQSVIVPTMTFAASANAVLYSGGMVEFVDIDSDTLNLDTEAVAEKIETDPDRYAGVIAVDFAGYPVNTQELAAICHEQGKWLLEDSSHALGAVASYGDQTVTVGSSQYSDATVFSFHPAKHITTGEGGMITTRRHELEHTLRLIRSHAMNRDHNGIDEEPWRYEIDQLGFNYRISEISAALGRSQLKRAAINLHRRQDIAANYLDAFDGTNIQTPNYDMSHTNAYHLFVTRVQDRKEVYAGLQEAGIFPQIHYVPLHMQPFYRGLAQGQAFPNSEKYYQECLSLPMFPSLSQAEQQYVIDNMLELTKG